jgi:hypothetical protein
MRSGAGRLDGPAPRARRRAAALVALLVATTAVGCNVSPEQRAATERAWAERDAARARECHGRFVAGGCVYGGP